MPIVNAPAPIMIDDNRLEAIVGGETRFDRLLQLIGAAQTSIDLIFYIFKADVAGTSVRDALIAARLSGVAVRLIVDSFGGGDTPSSFFEPLRAAGGQTIYFSRAWRSSYLIRNHQKLVIADRTTVLVGGFNIADSYFGPPRYDGWADLGLILTGPAAVPMNNWFDQLFHFAAHDDGKWLRLRQMIRWWQNENPQSGPLQWLVGGPTERLSPWVRALRTDLTLARRVDLVMAYFSPGQSMLRRLARAARRGTVRLVTASRSDNGATVGASRLLYRYLLRNGAAIHEFLPQKLHMKLVVVDDMVYVGSANFDMRSLFLNLEVMLRIESAAFAGAVRAMIDQMVDQSEAVTPGWLARHGNILTRLKWLIAWSVVGVVDYTVARRLNFGLEHDPDSASGPDTTNSN